MDASSTMVRAGFFTVYDLAKQIIAELEARLQISRPVGRAEPQLESAVRHLQAAISDMQCYDDLQPQAEFVSKPAQIRPDPQER